MSKTIFNVMPDNDKPRERLKECGAHALSNQELLAILLRTGTKEFDVIHLAMQVLERVGDLSELKAISMEELIAIKGIGPSKAVEVLAAIELGKRIYRSKSAKGATINSSQWVGQYMIDEIGGLHQENVLALYLNTKNQIIKQELVFKGSLTNSIAHPREIFRIGIRSSAASIIIGHNHPSGNPEPSQADIAFTRRMEEAGDLIGIQLLDHIIVGEDSFCSMRGEGYL